MSNQQAIIEAILRQKQNNSAIPPEVDMGGFQAGPEMPNVEELSPKPKVSLSTGGRIRQLFDSVIFDIAQGMGKAAGADTKAQAQSAAFSGALQGPQVREERDYMRQQRKQNSDLQRQQVMERIEQIRNQNRMVDTKLGPMTQAQAARLGLEQLKQDAQTERQRGKDSAAMQREELKAQSQAKMWDKKAAIAQMVKRQKAGAGGSFAKAPSGYQWTEEGGLSAIPGGPADLKRTKEFNQAATVYSGSVAQMDRLASEANKLLQHPGLDRIFGLVGAVPDMPGSDAATARAILDTLKSQVGFNVLQEMRNNSKTGGALGNVSDKEVGFLQTNLAPLGNLQSPEAAKEALQQIIAYAEAAKGRFRDAFERMDTGSKPQQQGNTPPAGAKVPVYDLNGNLVK